MWGAGGPMGRKGAPSLAHSTTPWLWRPRPHYHAFMSQISSAISSKSKSFFSKKSLTNTH